MAKKTPAQVVKEKFGEKAKLVEAVQAFVGEDLWVSALNESKGLAHVSNAKLLRLLDTFTTVKSKFGTRAKLIDAIVDGEGRTKDADYKKHFAEWPVPRLYDHFTSLQKRQAAAAASAKKAAARAAAKKK
jgi:hypothetical protein